MASLRRFGFEATGNYHRPLAHHLGQAGFDLKLVSSVGLARTREALHNSWDKNDPKDAQVILRMLEIGAVQFFHDPLATGIADIQELSKTHEIVSRSKTELWHRILTHYLPLYFPEAGHYSARHYARPNRLQSNLKTKARTEDSKHQFPEGTMPEGGRRIRRVFCSSGFGQIAVSTLPTYFQPTPS